jgi:regulator of ribonuclease activity A
MKPIATADLCDAFRDEADASAQDFRVLPPVFRDFGGQPRFHGPVWTVRCFEDNSEVKRAVESPGAIATPEGPVGRVLVVDGGSSLRRALVGGNLAASAVANGWAGIVVAGAVRDLPELAACALGLRALAPCPLPCLKRGEGEAGVPLRIAGLVVRPGDWLYADEDGIVIAATPLHG